MAGSRIRLYGGVAVAMASLAGAAAQEGVVPIERAVSVEGEVVHLDCYLSDPAGGRGEAHAECGRRDGPLALLAEGTLYVLLAADGVDLAALLGDRVGETVALDAMYREVGGVRVLRVTGIAAAAVEPPPAEGPALLYGCPMNCIEPRPEPGDCPVCGMRLVPREGGG